MGQAGGFVIKIIILIGNYCSAKSEIALNLSVRAAGRGLRTQAVDLNRTSDYFRMSDHIHMLDKRGLDVVSHQFHRQEPDANRHARPRHLRLRRRLGPSRIRRRRRPGRRARYHQNFAGPDLLRGWEVLREVSERIVITVVLTSGRPPLLDQFLADGCDPSFKGVPMPLKPYMLRSPDNFAHC